MISKEMQTAQDIEDALLEAAEAFNVALREDRPDATISRRSLYLLTVGAAQGFGVIDSMRFIERMK